MWQTGWPGLDWSVNIISFLCTVGRLLSSGRPTYLLSNMRFRHDNQFNLGILHFTIFQLQ